ncbi:MAG: dynamin family protein [Chthoniobacterales bacterium]
MVVEKYLELRSHLGSALGSLVSLAQQIGAPADTIQHLQNLINGLKEPFLFVVVGEVKAGKSMLLNALFGRDFCKVDVLPATDRIYVFKYGETEKDIPISEHLTERWRSIDFLKDFNIVDTPGTNTIVANHEEITESFVPLADLIVFVFSVTNPWAASSWDFLRLISNQWKKNIVFVVQQADLRDEAEVASVVKHLDQTILQILGSNRPIFAVSAKQAFQAKTTADGQKQALWKASNFGPLEAWITQTVSHSEERGGKVRSITQTAQVVVGDLRSQIQGSLDILKSDQEKLATIRGGLDSRKDQTMRQVGGFIREMEMAYDACRERGEKLLEDRLSFGQTIRMIFSGGHWEKDFQDQVESDVKTKVQAQIEHALTLLESDLRSIWQDLQERVSAQFGAARQIRAVMPGFLSQREVVLQRLQLTLLEQMSDARVKEQLQSLFGETARWLRIPTGVAAAGGIFTIIAALTHTAILDVTGTVAGLAALTGTLYAVFRRRKTLREYRERMNEKRKDLATAVETQLKNAIAVFYQEVAQTFSPLESFCEAEARRHLPMKERIDQLDRTLFAIKEQVG